MPRKQSKATSMAERVAILETEISAVVAKLESNSAVLVQIDQKLSRQKGFIGGVIFVVSALWALALAALKFIPVKP